MKALIFDMDGVLTDSTPIHNWAFRETLRPYGIDVDYARIAGMRTLNAAAADHRLDGKRSLRVEALCREHGGKGSPCDFVSIHSYNCSELMATKLIRAKEVALEIDPDYYNALWVNSHESCPDWMPPPPARDNIWDLFLQAFDEGRLTDAMGLVADLRHCLIILTSNLGATAHRSLGLGFAPQEDVFTKEQVLRAYAAQHTVMENANALAAKAIRTCGGQSMLKSLPLERIYRDSRCGSLMLPWTAEICIDRLGRETLYELGEKDE